MGQSSWFNRLAVVLVLLILVTLLALTTLNGVAEGWLALLNALVLTLLT